MNRRDFEIVILFLLLALIVGVLIWLVLAFQAIQIG